MKPGPKSKVQSPKSPTHNSQFTTHNSFDFVKEKAGIREWRLIPNALQLLLLQNRVAPVTTFAIVYRVGSRNEAVGYTG
ncbi:MAG TPA: hypothetical protein VER78_07575, partial [Thermoanaerobaculia bacterium]|nr:hypothetical protein [Thermoanaerobaculia bacterium]